MNHQWVIRHRFWSFSVASQSVITVAMVMLLTLLVMLLSLCAGTEWISPGQLLSALFYPPGLLHPQASQTGNTLVFVVESLRMPRMLMAAMVGAALGCAGLLLQSMIRNPLASPDVVGLTSGASAAAVCFLAFFHSMLPGAWLPVFAIAGAMLAAIAIYLLAWRDGVTPMRLILVGIGVSAALGAVTTFAIAVSPEATTMTAYIWLTGSVYGSDWESVKALFPWLAVCLPLSLCLTRRINAQALGDQVATGLGIPVQAVRFGLLGLSALLAAPAVAYAGAVGFVGLIAPHIARQLVSRSFALLMPVTACIGAMLVMLADMSGRLLFQPLDIPAGVFVSAIGAPFFIFLLYRQRF